MTLYSLDVLTQRDEPFLLVDDGGADKIIVFATILFLRMMAESSCVYMDGTFYSAPKHFDQFYTLHILKRNTMLPCVRNVARQTQGNIHAVSQ